VSEVKEVRKTGDELFEQLRKLAPGTELRQGIELILHARTGGLIVIGDYENVKPLCDGGFEVTAPFSANTLAELAKMDGAIILDENLQQVLKVNVHLMPDPEISTTETGTRHRTAERVSKQTNALVIAISESKDLVSVYYRGKKYVLEDIRTLLSKANQALQTLERYRYRFDQEARKLTAVEFQEIVTLSEVISAIQRAQMLIEVAREIERYIALLGSEGRLIKMQLDELIAGIDEEYNLIIMDYKKNRKDVFEIREKIDSLTPQELLEEIKIAKLLGYPTDPSVLEEIVIPKGFRALKKIPRLPMAVIENIVKNYGNLSHILKASVADLDDVEGVGEVRARSVVEGLQRLKDTSLKEIAPI
jgi:diadenylate cyclase